MIEPYWIEMTYREFFQFYSDPDNKLIIRRVWPDPKSVLVELILPFLFG